MHGSREAASVSYATGRGRRLGLGPGSSFSLIISFKLFVQIITRPKYLIRLGVAAK